MFRRKAPVSNAVTKLGSGSNTPPGWLDEPQYGESTLEADDDQSAHAD